MARLISYLLSLLGLLSSNLAQAEEGKPFYKDAQNGWIIETSENSICLAKQRSARGEQLIIGFDAAEDVAALWITTRDLFEQQDVEEVGIHIVLATDKELLSISEKHDFKLTKRETFSILRGAFQARDLFNDIVRSDTIEFSRDGTFGGLISSFSITGGADAIDALRRCASEVAGMRQ